MRADVVVVGAGAAGIFAAWRAASLGKKVVLLEKTGRIGTKILISGGGKCNICHDGPIEDVLRAFRKEEAVFIRPSVYKFPNHEVVKLLTDRGIRVYTRPDGRIFPVDQTAKDVVAVLRQLLTEVGVKVFLNSPVAEILSADGVVKGVRTKPGAEKRPVQVDRVQYGAKGLLNEVLATEGEDQHGLGEQTIESKTVIIATGGSSYPNSGTTGDGWNWLRDLGHTIEWVHAALAPIYLEVDPWDPSLSGLAVRDIVLRAKLGKKEIERWRNDLLFTHQGVSGPTVLGVSRVVAENMADGSIALIADLLPDLNHDAVTDRLLNQNPKRQVRTQLEEWLPERMALKLLHQTGIVPDLPFSRLDKKSRNKLVESLKQFSVGTVRTVPIEKGEVVAGGVSLGEVDPQTMESKKNEHLFLCGEVLNVAGPVGGYNLQAAFATGFVAGQCAASKC